LETQLLHLIGDLVPSTGGAVLLGRDEDEIRAATAGRSAPFDLEAVAARTAREGSVLEPEGRVAALGLYARGNLAGGLGEGVPAEAAGDLADARDTLSAIATLGAAALETVREIERLQAENAQLLERIGAGDTGILGESPAIKKLLQMMERVAPLETSV